MQTNLLMRKTERLLKIDRLVGVEFIYSGNERENHHYFYFWRNLLHINKFRFKCFANSIGNFHKFVISLRCQFVMFAVVSFIKQSLLMLTALKFVQPCQKRKRIKCHFVIKTFFCFFFVDENWKCSMASRWTWREKNSIGVLISIRVLCIDLFIDE